MCVRISHCALNIRECEKMRPEESHAFTTIKCEPGETLNPVSTCVDWLVWL
jgi:hypothetical protein